MEPGQGPDACGANDFLTLPKNSQIDSAAEIDRNTMYDPPLRAISSAE
jgi:hypothetical protein